MTVLIGTNNGLYRVSELPFDDAERVLDCGFVARIRKFDAMPGIFAATRSGLYHSTDEGETWDPIEVPADEIWSVLATDETTLYAGSADPYLFRSTDGGDTWEELEGFRELPSRELWRSPKSEDEAWFRDFAYHPDYPDRLIVGIEAGGIHASHDGGETWEERRDGIVKDDVHQIHVVGSDEFIVPCGRLDLGTDVRGDAGLYRTTDAGRTWTRLDTDIEPEYFREVIVHDGTLFVCGSRTRPSVWADGWEQGIGADAALFESDDMGDTFREMDYPCGPEHIVLAWTGKDGSVLAGTGGWGAAMSPMDSDDERGYKRGHLLQRTDEGWETTGTVPAQIHSLLGL